MGIDLHHTSVTLRAATRKVGRNHKGDVVLLVASTTWRGTHQRNDFTVVVDKDIDFAVCRVGIVPLKGKRDRAANVISVHLTGLIVATREHVNRGLRFRVALIRFIINIGSKEVVQGIWVGLLGDQRLVPKVGGPAHESVVAADGAAPSQISADR